MISAVESAQLAATGARVRTLAAQTRAERGRRNSIVRELIDRGVRYRSVARASGLSVAAVAGIARSPASHELLVPPAR